MALAAPDGCHQLYREARSIRIEVEGRADPADKGSLLILEKRFKAGGVRKFRAVQVPGHQSQGEEEQQGKHRSVPPTAPAKDPDHQQQH